MNEVEQKNRREAPPGDQNSPTEEELGQGTLPEGTVAELKSLVKQKDEELVKMAARLTELEQMVASKDTEIAGLGQSKAELDEKLTAVSGSLVEAVAGYKTMVVQLNPEVLEELISGDTIMAINESLTKAKTLINRVRLGVEAEISLIRVPSGAPERTSLDLSALSPREKIQYAVGSFSSGNR